MKKKIIIALVLLFAAAGGFLWWRAAHREKPVKIVAAEEVKRGTVRKVLEETGIVKAQVGAIVKIGARATGTIDRMLVKVGDQVAKGQLVAVIDRRELRAQEAEASARLASARAELARVRGVYPLAIDQAEAELDEAQAQAAYLKGNAERLAALYADKYVSRDEAENARQQAEAQAQLVAARSANLDRQWHESAEEQNKAEMAVRQNEATLESLRVRVSYTEIKSPIDGVVSQVTAQEGETIVAGLQVANLITVLDPQRLEMWVYVDETDVGQVQPGQKVEFKVDAYPGRIFEGEVQTIYPQPEIRDNIVYYQALVGISPEQATLLRPEMTTQVQIIVAEKTDVLLIPNNALKWVDGQQTVFVQAPDGAVRRITPKLGLAGVTHSEVAQGLAEGEKVATQVELPGAKAAKEKGKP